MKTRFQGIAVVSGKDTGDGRLVERQAIRLEDESWPLLLDHVGPVIGSIDTARWDGDLLRIEGWLDSDSENTDVLMSVVRVIELSEDGNAQLSVGLDDETIEVRMKADLITEINEETVEVKPDEPKETDSEGRVVVARWSAGDEVYAVTDSRLREVSVVTVGASNGSKITGITRPDLQSVAASSTVGSLVIDGTGLSILQGVVASVGRSKIDPAFANPAFGKDGNEDPRLVWQAPLRNDEVGHWGCPFTVEDDGTVYGHLATRGRCHGGYADRCINLDLLDPTYDFSEFLIGAAAGPGGPPTGVITLGTSHSVNPDGSIKDWDWLANTGDAGADVTLGRDEHGIWVAGRIRPGLSKAQVAALRGSALSGEWIPSPSKSGRRLAGILAVNSPGFAVARQPAVAASGAVVTTSPVCSSCGQVDPTMERLRLVEEMLTDVLVKGL